MEAGKLPGLKIAAAGRTHIGKVRTTNQDSYGSYEPTDPAELAQKGRIYVVCDGMGGAAGGETASALAIETVIERYRANSAGDTGEALRRAIEAANKRIWDTAKEKTELTGMGTTCVALVLKDGTAHIAHDGDSRCGLVRGEETILLTKDHSMVQEMLDAGIIEESEVADHPRKNVITRCLGVKPEIEVEYSSRPLQKGDVFYLCSDGLWGLVPKDEIRAIISEHEDDLAAAAKVLLEKADANGGTDNSTVQLARVVGGAPEGGAGGQPAPAAGAPVGAGAGGFPFAGGAEPLPLAKILMLAGAACIALFLLIWLASR